MRNFNLGLVLLVGSICGAVACGSDDDGGSPGSSGGTAGTSSSGGSSTSGGSSSSGGSTASGGSSSSTGGSSSSTGGSSSSTGGSDTSGGADGNSGGTTAAGGQGPGGGENPEGCPATAPEDGAACSVDLGFNESCDYTGVTCDCNMGGPGGPGGPGGGGDGAAEEGEWQCEEVAVCPATQPEGECTGNYPGGCEYDDVTCFCGPQDEWICPNFGGEGGGGFNFP